MINFYPDFVLAAGDVISITNNHGLTETHTVLPIKVTNVNLVNDTVSGTADPLADVTIKTWDDNGDHVRHVKADDKGDWTASFLTVGPGADEKNLYSLTAKSYGDARRTDGGGNYSRWDFGQFPWVNFSARLRENQVHAYMWPEGKPLTLTIHDPAFGTNKSNDYIEIANPYPAPWDPNQTFMDFKLNQGTPLGVKSIYLKTGAWFKLD